jgi:hypothetical protein
MNEFRSGCVISALLATFLGVTAASAAPALYLPDSDQRQCYDTAAPYGEIGCAGTGQDGEFIMNPLSYTAPGNGTVTDTHTGLIWQQQTDGIVRTGDEANTYCTSLPLGGTYDWRLPSIMELLSIVDYATGYPGPATATAYFAFTDWSADTVSGILWSSSPGLSLGPGTTTYYQLIFYSGMVSFSDSGAKVPVRCVRGDKIPQASLTDNGDHTVSDSRTGLVWQQDESDPMIWQKAMAYCKSPPVPDPTGWRLPNIKELFSLLETTGIAPLIDTAAFPRVQSNLYWSSTSLGNDPGWAWTTHFGAGFVDAREKSTEEYYVRCVRGGLTENSPPTANPGPSQSVVPGNAVSLDGSASSDPDADPLTYTWSFGAKPSGSSAALSDPASATPSFVADLQGTYLLSLVVNDGLVDSAPATVNITVAPDVTPPTGSILINNGAAWTPTTAVTLNLSATDTGGSGIGFMRFRNAVDPKWTGWENFQKTKAWTLNSVLGSKTVLVEYKDRAGNISDADPVAPGRQDYKDAIVLKDTIPPTGKILINNGAVSTPTPDVTLTLSADDTGGSGLGFMRFRNASETKWSEWEAFAATKAWTLNTVPGTKTVLAQFKDNAGNISDSDPVTAGRQDYRDSIVYK